MSLESKLHLPVTLLHLVLAAITVIVMAWIPILGYVLNGENRVTRLEAGLTYNGEKNTSQDRQLESITTLLAAVNISIAQTQIRLDTISSNVTKVQSSVENLSFNSKFNR